MIERIAIENFKSFRQIEVKLGKMNLFIGTNASGKSNFFDAMRVLQGIGYGFTFQEILDGKPKSATSEVWDGIRGGSHRAEWIGEADKPICFTVEGRMDNQEKWLFEISFGAHYGRLHHERFNFLGTEIYQSVSSVSLDPIFEVRYYGGKKGRPIHLKFEKNRSVLSQMAKGGNGKWLKAHAEAAEKVTHSLADMQRVDPLPTVLRSYSQAHEIHRMGEHGENFAALVKTICMNQNAREAYVSWLKELRPQEVDDVGTLSGAVGEPLFMLKEGGREFPAPVLSDGTLRFAAIAIAFFQPDMPGLLTIEEIENGIHANRLRLLVELLRNRAQQGNTQILATTHSPIVLAWLKPEEYTTTFFCKRDEDNGESRVASLPNIPHFNAVVSKTPISDLFAEGWLEAAL